mmetsp:Transcript_15726/g.34769  ORF Transcript_15726/g.34769 Transcript_15726/m.34769 type:complete len:224 (-) Transcript_15726:65-736(-)
MSGLADTVFPIVSRGRLRGCRFSFGREGGSTLALEACLRGSSGAALAVLLPGMGRPSSRAARSSGLFPCLVSLLSAARSSKTDARIAVPRIFSPDSFKHMMRLSQSLNLTIAIPAGVFPSFSSGSSTLAREQPLDTRYSPISSLVTSTCMLMLAMYGPGPLGAKSLASRVSRRFLLEGACCTGASSGSTLPSSLEYSSAQFFAVLIVRSVPRDVEFTANWGPS